MTKLIYTGKTIDEVGVVPLPEGWPAANHIEDDPLLAAEKLASRSYREDRHLRVDKPASEPVKEG